eukprot:1162113-Pelagomonas_calceolata.AAC.8
MKCTLLGWLRNPSIRNVANDRRDTKHAPAGIQTLPAAPQAAKFAELDDSPPRKQVFLPCFQHRWALTLDTQIWFQNVNCCTRVELSKV